MSLFFVAMEVVKQKIESLLDEKLKDTDCFLVDIKTSGSKIQVFIDCDKGMNVQRCAEVSRYLESYLDESDLVSENYILEVSSPGVGQPLKLRRQYSKNIGRKVIITLEDGSQKKGTLKSVNDEGIVLEEKADKKGKSSKKETIESEISFNKIKETKVVITF